MLKQSMLIGLFLAAGHAYSANISVTTTEDIDKDDQQCSLREAIEYVNLRLPKEGYHGCGGEGSSSVIELQKKEIYKLKEQIRITESLSITTVYSSSSENGEAVVKGLNNAIIRMEGNDRIFWIEDTKKTYDEDGKETDVKADKTLLVTLSEVSLEGCGTTQCKQDEGGGLIYNDEVLRLEYARLSGGRATKGGAIYNVTLPYVDKDGKEGTALSFVSAMNVIFEKNIADEGAVLYGVIPRFLIQNALIMDNETQNTGSTAIESEKAEDAKALENITDIGKITTSILNSTFIRNKGKLVRVRDNVGLNNLTIVANTGGVVFDAPLGKAYLANSILAGNPYPVAQSADCTIVSGDKSVLQNNLVGASCGTGDPKYPNDIMAGTALIAGKDIVGTCNTDYTDKESLLCPLLQNDKTFIGYLKPRIPLIYRNLSESAIIDTGVLQSGKDISIGCMGSDQRGVSRQSDPRLCDRGAIEVVVPETLGTIGDEILPGQTVHLSVKEALKDVDLLPADQCDALVGKHPNGEQWQAGCMLLEQTHTSSKGKVTIDNDGNVVYVPNSGWRGADTFKLRLITTATRFNLTNKYLPVNVNILVEPDNIMKSDKLGGGSFGLFGFLGLAALAGLRRFKK